MERDGKIMRQLIAAALMVGLSGIPAAAQESWAGKYYKKANDAKTETTAAPKTPEKIDESRSEPTPSVNPVPFRAIKQAPPKSEPTGYTLERQHLSNKMLQGGAAVALLGFIFIWKYRGTDVRVGSETYCVNTDSYGFPNGDVDNGSCSNYDGDYRKVAYLVAGAGIPTAVIWAISGGTRGQG